MESGKRRAGEFTWYNSIVQKASELENYIEKKEETSHAG